jgi:hypothetical protein
MKLIRRLHAWLGVIFAPSILLFAFSGIVQMFGCHEAEGTTPGVLARMAQIHMKQTVELPRRRASKPAAAAAKPADPTASEPPRGGPPSPAASPGGAQPTQPTTMPLKVFFTAMSFGLIASTLLGLYMAFRPKRDRVLFAGLLAAGTVVPIVLMML